MSGRGWRVHHGLRAWGNLFAFSLAAAGLFSAFAFFVLRPREDEWAAILRILSALALGVPALGLFAGWLHRPVFAALESARAASARGTAPALGTHALRAIERAPLTAAGPVYAFAVLAVVLDAAGLVPWTGLSGGRAVAAAFAAVGCLQLALHASALVWRGSTSAALATVPLRNVTRAARPALARRLVLRTVSTSAFVAAWAVAAFLVAAGEHPALHRTVPIVVLVVYGAQLVALVLAYRFGLRVATDVRHLTAFVGALRSDEEWTSTGELPVLGAPLSTQPAEALNQAIVAVAERFARVANEETRVRGVLERAERLRPRFMAYVSHDLRGPLNSIKGFAEILSRGEDPPLSPEQRESLATIQESGEELLRLVTEIIDSTRLVEGRIELFPRWTPIVTLLTEAVGQVRLLRRRRPIELETHLQPGLPVLRVDRARLVQALVSIMAFLQHPLTQGAIHVNVRVIEARPGNPAVVRFEFRSTPGVDRGDGAHLFEALRPGRGPTGQRVAGLGVGLSLARGLVERHGGELSYRPGLQQAGGRFVMDLPVASEGE